MLPHQFRDNVPCQLGSSYGMRTTPLFPRQHNSPKRKGGMRESFPRQVDKKSGVPKEREVWDIQGGRKENFLTFFPSTFLRII